MTERKEATGNEWIRRANKQNSRDFSKSFCVSWNFPSNNHLTVEIGCEHTDKSHLTMRFRVKSCSCASLKFQLAPSRHVVIFSLSSQVFSLSLPTLWLKLDPVFGHPLRAPITQSIPNSITIKSTIMLKFQFDPPQEWAVKESFSKDFSLFTSREFFNPSDNFSTGSVTQMGSFPITFEFTTQLSLSLLIKHNRVWVRRRCLQMSARQRQKSL